MSRLQARPQRPDNQAQVRQRAVQRWQAIAAAAAGLTQLLVELLPEIQQHFGARVRLSGEPLLRLAAQAQQQAQKAASIIDQPATRPVDDLSRQLAGVAGTMLVEVRRVLPDVGRLAAYQDSFNHKTSPHPRRPHIAQRVDYLLRLLHGP